LNHASGTRRRPRLLVVSYLAHAVLSPRGARTQALLGALSDDWNINLVAGPATNPSSAKRGRRIRSSARSFVSAFMLDKFEPWSWRHLRSLPSADAAYLIAAPFSPLAYATRSLVRANIPYVVDVGDPWVLTADVPEVRGLAFRRALHAEFRTWQHAVGGVLTTGAQASALAEHFPQLPLLVRPNGAWPGGKLPGPPSQPDSQRLLIGHFGNIYNVRVDIAPLLDSLALSGLWETVELHQYGRDWANALARVRAARVVWHEPLRWNDLLGKATGLDAALVIGNRDRKQLPSKAVDYLTVPIPRIAVTRSKCGDALLEYLAGKPGWLVLAPDARDAAYRVREHVARPWSMEELALPASERWDIVARVVAGFVRDRLLGEVPLRST